MAETCWRMPISLLVHDVSDEAVAALVGKGAEAAGSAAALGEQCDVVFTSLPTPQIVREAVLGADGVTSKRAPRILCDLSTSGPQLAAELADALTQEASPASMRRSRAGLPGREGGHASRIMVGGPEAALSQSFGRCWSAWASPRYMGETPGAGQTMKLVNNLLGAVAIGVTAEGMAFGIKARARPGKDDRGAEPVHRHQFGHARQVAARRPAAHVRLRLCRRAQPEGHQAAAGRGGGRGRAAAAGADRGRIISSARWNAKARMRISPPLPRSWKKPPGWTRSARDEVDTFSVYRR